MKKKSMAILIAAVLAALTACGGTDSGTPSEKTDANTDTSDMDTPEAEADTGTSDTADEAVGFNDDWAAASKEARAVQMGEKVTEDGLITFSVEKTYWLDELVPARPEGSYNYVESEDGYSFLVCEGTVQNLTSEEVELSSSMGPLWGSVATVFIFDDTEAYYGDWYTGEGSISFSLEPGKEDTLYIAAAVPDEMKDNCEKVQVLTGFSDLQEQAGTPMGTETGVNWPALPHKYLLDAEL